MRKALNDSEFILLKYFVINGSVTDTDFWTIIRPQVASITIKVEARKEFSGARIRGVIMYLDQNDLKEIISDEQIFPAIKESTDVSKKLSINGIDKTPHSDMCIVHETGQKIVITFECESQVLPCSIEISATDLRTPLCGKGYVTHTSGLPNLNITIKYATCALNGKIEFISCTIYLEIDRVTDESCSCYIQNKVVIAWISMMLMIILALMISLWKFELSSLSETLGQSFNLSIEMSSDDLNLDNEGGYINYLIDYKTLTERISNSHHGLLELDHNQAQGAETSIAIVSFDGEENDSTTSFIEGAKKIFRRKKYK